jgi:hypothetical protein
MSSNPTLAQTSIGVDTIDLEKGMLELLNEAPPAYPGQEHGTIGEDKGSNSGKHICAHCSEVIGLVKQFHKLSERVDSIEVKKANICDLDLHSGRLTHIRIIVFPVVVTFWTFLWLFATNNRITILYDFLEANVKFWGPTAA